MKNKYFYPIYKLKAKSWIRYWLLKKTEFKGKLSEILTGFSFNLQNTLRQKFVKFEILGNSVQDGEHSPENEVPIKSAGENENLLNTKEINSQFSNIIINDDESITFKGTVPSYSFSLQNPIVLKANKPYTLSLTNKYSGAQGSAFTLGNNDTNIMACKYSEGLITYTPTTDTTINVIRIYNEGINYSDYTFSVKLEQSTIASKWSPFGMGSITEKIVNGNFMTYPEDFEITNLGIISKQSKGIYNLNGTTIYAGTFLVQQKLKEPVQIKDGDFLHIMNSVANDKVAILLNYPDGTNKSYGLIEANRIVSLSTDIGKKIVGISFYCNTANTSISINLKPMILQSSSATDYIAHQEQTYTIPVQAPFRSIGDVRDVFFKNTVDSPYYDENLVENGWYERHLPYIASYNNEVLPQDVYNEVGGIKYCNEKSMSTTGQFSIGASVQYIDENNWNYILCTPEQIDILENIPSTFSGQTNVFSIDEVKAYLKIQYWESDSNG